MLFNSINFIIFLFAVVIIMCYSPYYGQGIPKSIRMIEEMAAKNGVQFLNYGDDERF